MGFTIYDLVLSTLLFVNAYAIINERFVIQCEKMLHKLGKAPRSDGDFSFMGRLLGILDADSKKIFQMPLIWINIIVVILELLP